MHNADKSDLSARAHDSNKAYDNVRVHHTTDAHDLYIEQDSVIGNNLVVHGSFSGNSSIHGPSSSTPLSPARFADATGSALTSAPLIISNDGNLTGINTLNATLITADLNGTASTASYVGGQNASSIAWATQHLLDSSSSNNYEQIVQRDTSGSFVTTMITLTGAINNPTDAVTQEYVTTFAASSFLVREPVNAASAVNLATLSGPQDIDDITVNPGDRVLLTAQTNAVENGIWEVRAGSWTPRPSDFTSGSQAEKSYVLVRDGNTLGGTSWVCTTPDAIIDTDPLYFSLFELQGQTTGSNSGSGQGTIFKEKIGNTLQFKTLVADNHMLIDNAVDTLSLAVSATSEPLPLTLAMRDANGDLAAYAVTASLTGSASDNIMRSGDSMMGTFTLVAGSQNNPSLQFASSLHTGLSALLPNTIDFSTNGIQRMSIAPTGTLTITNFSTPGIIHNDAAGNLSSTLISNDSIDASAAIRDTKLTTISTPGKVLDSATTATSEPLINTIVLRDNDGNFSANTITASFINGTLANYVARAGDSMTGTFTVIAGTLDNPALQYEGSYATGLSAPSPNNLVLSTQGNDTLSITETGTVIVEKTLMLAHASSSPSLICGTEDDTGIASSDSQNLSFFSTNTLCLTLTNTSIVTHTALALKNSMSIGGTIETYHITSYGTFPISVADTTSLLIVRYPTGGPITIELTLPQHPYEGQLFTIKALLEPIPPATSNNLNLTYTSIFEPETEEVIFLNPTLALNTEGPLPNRGTGGATVTYIYHTQSQGFPTSGWYRYRRG